MSKSWNLYACKTSDYFPLLFFLVISPSSTTTLRFPFYLLINISLGKWVFNTSHIKTRQFICNCNNIAWGVVFFVNENVIFFEKKTWASNFLRKKFPRFYLILLTYFLCQHCEKICKQRIWHLFSINHIMANWLIKTTVFWLGSLYLYLILIENEQLYAHKSLL